MRKNFEYKKDVKQWAESFITVIERDAKLKDYDAKNYKRHIINKIQELCNKEVDNER